MKPIQLSRQPAKPSWRADAIVLGGSLRDRGMPAYGPIFDKKDSDAVHAFVIDMSRRAYESQ